MSPDLTTWDEVIVVHWTELGCIRQASRREARCDVSTLESKREQGPPYAVQQSRQVTGFSTVSSMEREIPDGTFDLT